MGGSDPPAFLFLQRDQTGLSRKHFNGDAEDAGQEDLEIEFLGESTGYFQQVVALADAEIGKHMDGILSPACLRNVRDLKNM